MNIIYFIALPSFGHGSMNAGYWCKVGTSERACLIKEVAI
jgi:hypothetical protein